MKNFAITMKTKAVTIAAFVFIVAFSAIRSTFFPEADIFWGARNGMDILQNGIHIFQPDTWNLQTLGEEWSPNSWLWNVLLAVFYMGFDNYGFLLLTLITNIAAFGFLWAYLQRLRIAPLPAYLILIGSFTVMTMFMNGRSNTADLLILTMFLYLCHKLRHKLISLLITCFTLTVLWMNLHMTGIAAAAIFPSLVYAMLHGETVKKRLLKSLCAFGATLVALPVTPYGLAGLLKVSLVQNESKDMMIEWSNVFSMPGGMENILLLLAAALVVLYFILRGKQYLYGLLTIALIYGTYDTIRLTPFLLTVVLGALVFWEGKTYNLHPRLKSALPMISWLLVAATLGVSVISGMSVVKVVADENQMFPISSAQFEVIPDNSRAAVSQNAGSTIILYRPDVLVTLDGRNDLLGMDRFLEASNILYSEDSEELSDWLKKHDINVVFLEKGFAGADIVVANMDKLGWELRTSETGSSAYVKLGL